MLLVETEGSYTVQQNYTNMDIHVGQSYSFLVTMDQTGSNDYYIVASHRMNLTTGAARPNPQGSFRYGEITVTNVYLLQNKPPQLINGKRHTTLNDISFFIPSTPLKLAQQFNVLGIYKLDFPKRPMNRPPVVDTSVINSTYKGFIEIILQNSDTTIQSYHLDGYAFFVVGMDYGVWTENSRSVYNKLDGIARSTTQ
nr:monocopper oxidase-like protein SKU5 [Tanacetum cinerariifolium]